MRIKHRLAALAVVLLGLGGLAGGTVIQAVPALATQQQICGNGGTGYCMNDWNHQSGGIVKMYYGNSSNEDFYIIFDNRCDGGHTVLSTEDGDPVNCPFATASLDFQYRGYNIVEVQYGPYDECIGGSGSAAYLQDCSTGTGTVQITDYESCNGGAQLINRYQSDLYGLGETVTSGGSVGSQLLLNVSQSDGTCWGGL